MRTRAQIEAHLREHFEADLPGKVAEAAKEAEESLRRRFEDELPDMIEDAEVDAAIEGREGLAHPHPADVIPFRREP